MRSSAAIAIRDVSICRNPTTRSRRCWATAKAAPMASSPATASPGERTRSGGTLRTTGSAGLLTREPRRGAEYRGARSSVLRYHDVRELRGHVLGGLRDLDREPARDRPVDFRRPALGIGDHGRLARVGVLADIDVERQGPEKLGAVFPAHALGAALPEDVLLVAAVRADVRAHVLDDAEDGNADFLEHLEALAGVDERDVLGRGDDHGACHRHLLGERELDVGGAGRRVDDEVVDIAPARVPEELL